MRGVLWMVVVWCWSALAHAGPDVQAAGATFPSAVYQSWAATYEKKFGKKVNYLPTGSGDGIKRMIAREVIFAGTDSPLSAAELAKNGLIQLPTLVGGIVPVVNVRGVGNNDLHLTGEVLADIFRGEVTSWNDPRIRATNAHIDLPNTPIVRIVRSEKSGSTEGFTKYLALVSSHFKQEIGASSLPTWPVKARAVVAVQGNDGVAEAIAKTPGAIGYLSYDRVGKLGLNAVQLPSGSGMSYVSASEAGFSAAVRQSGMVRTGEERTSLLNMNAVNAWPITLTTYVLFEAQPKTAASVNQALHFLYWTQLQGDSLLRNTGFAPLPVSVQARFAERLSRVQAQDHVPLNFR